ERPPRGSRDVRVVDTARFLEHELELARRELEKACERFERCGVLRRAARLRQRAELDEELACARHEGELRQPPLRAALERLVARSETLALRERRAPVAVLRERERGERLPVAQ